MNLSNDQFKNQPRLGAAIRQRSHSSKELTTMLQQLQLSVQLMPLNNNNLKIKNQSNLLASTSEEESDSMNSLETTTSEDEAFGDFEDEEYDDYKSNNLQTNKSSTKKIHSSKLIQLKDSLTVTDKLTFPKKSKYTNVLRRSNSLGSLLNIKKLQANNELFCVDELDSMDDLRKNKLNNRNNSLRSTLPHNRYSISLKDNLNKLTNDNYKSNQLFRLTNYLNDKNDLKSNNFLKSSINNSKKIFKSLTKSIELDEINKINFNIENNLFNLTETNMITHCKDENDEKSINQLSKLTNNQLIEEEKLKLKDLYLKNTKIINNEYKFNNNQIQLDDNLKKFNIDNINSKLNIFNPNYIDNDNDDDHKFCAATSGLNQTKFILEDINKVVNYKLPVSSCICNSTVKYSTSSSLNIKKEDNYLNLNLIKINNELNSNSLECEKKKKKNDDHLLNEQKIEFNKFNKINKFSNYNELLSPIVTTINSISDQTNLKNKSIISSSYLQNKLNIDHHYLDSESIDKHSLKKEQIKKLNDKKIDHSLLNSDNFYKNDEQKLDSFLKNKNQNQNKNQIKNNKEFNNQNCDNHLKELLLNLNNSIFKDNKYYSIINKSNYHSKLPIVFEIEESNLNNNNYKNLDSFLNKSTNLDNKMQTLAETQYNQLSYHLAALSCVCDNSTTSNNKNTNYSSFNQPSSSVDSSPNSSQYSSPYNLSPPSSPSSVSSYSSAEEDCTILTNDLKINSTLKKQNSLVDLLTIDHNKSNNLNDNCDSSDNNDDQKNEQQSTVVEQSKENLNLNINENEDVVDFAAAVSTTTAFKDSGLLITALVNKLNNNNNLNNNDLNNNKKIEMKQNINNEDGSQLDNEFKNNNQINDNKLESQNNKPVRVRKTSILRNQAPDFTNCNNNCKKVVFADSLGLQLEKIKYFPPLSPQVKPKRHSVNLASLARDYYDEHQELFILHSRPQNKDTLAKQFEERSTLFSKQQARLNLNTNIFNNNQPARSYSPPHQSSNNFWANYTNYHQFSPIRDQYCGDMFHQTFEQKHNLTNLTSNSTIGQLNVQQQSINQQLESNSFVNTQLNQQNTNSQPINSNYPPCNYKSNSLEFNGLNFMNSQINQFNSNQKVSFLPLNFGQPYISSEFGSRLRSQSVLLHSLDVVGNTINGVVSVINLTFEKKVTVKYTLNKWVTEKYCEARYSTTDFDNSDKFIFQITIDEQDFPQYQLDDDRTMMFAICYKTGDGRIYWDNNYSRDFRAKIKFN